MELPWKINENPANANCHGPIKKCCANFGCIQGYAKKKTLKEIENQKKKEQHDLGAFIFLKN